MEEKIIVFVRKNKCLFEKKDSKYKNVYLRDKLFNELAMQLKIPHKRSKFKTNKMTGKNGADKKITIKEQNPEISSFKTYELQILLNSWGLHHLHATFTRFGITKEVLPYIKLRDIDQIFQSEADFCNKMLFRGKLNEWRMENNYEPLLQQQLTEGLTDHDIMSWIQTSSNCSFVADEPDIVESRNRKRRRCSSSLGDTRRIKRSDFGKNYSTNKTWLNSFHEPWATVEIKWQATFKGRRHELENIEPTSCKIQTAFKEWPLLLSANGFRLIDIDFENNYYRKSLLLMSKWNRFAQVAPEVLKKHISNSKFQNKISNLTNILNKDTKNIELFKLLHRALPSTTSATKSRNNKRCWKPSIENSIPSFVLEIANHNEIETKLDQIKSHLDSNLHPLVLAVGEKDESKEFFTAFNGIRYKFCNILTAVDCCFKILSIFHIKYPVTSKNVWIFFQRYFYEIATKDDTVDSKLLNFINDCQFHSIKS